MNKYINKNKKGNIGRFTRWRCMPTEISFSKNYRVDGEFSLSSLIPYEIDVQSDELHITTHRTTVMTFTSECKKSFEL